MSQRFLVLFTTFLLMSTPALADPTFITGGVGSEERAMIEAEQKNYSLKLVVTGEGGMYLSGLRVEITDATGAPVLSTILTGPILLAKLEKGHYVIHTMLGEDEANLVSKTSEISIGNKGLRVVQVVFSVADAESVENDQGDYLVRTRKKHHRVDE